MDLFSLHCRLFLCKIIPNLSQLETLWLDRRDVLQLVNACWRLIPVNPICNMSRRTLTLT